MVLRLRFWVGAVPAPVRATGCEPGPLSLMVSVAFRVPVTVGAKVTEMSQEPPGGTATVQVLPVTLYEAAPVPVIGVVGRLTRRSAEPVLETLMVSGFPDVPTFWLGKATFVVSRVAAGAVVPRSVTTWEPAAELSGMVSVALLARVADGVKVTSTEHLFPGTTVVLVQVSLVRA